MSALDDLLGGGVILRDGSGAQVSPIATDVQVTGVATVVFDGVKHVIDFGALGTAVANSVWFFNGATGVWSTAPVLSSISAGNAPAGSGAFRMGNADQFMARDAGGTDVELLAYGNDNRPRLAGVRYPLRSTVGTGSIGSVVRVESDGVLSVATLPSLGATLVSENITPRKTAKDGTGDAMFSCTVRGAISVPYVTATPLPVIPEATYAGMGASHASVTYQTACVEIVITGEDGHGRMFQQTFRGLIYRLRTSGDAWAIDSGMAHITGLDVGTPTAGFAVTAVLSLSGTTNGDITLTLQSTYASGTPHADWVYEVRITGGGRYA